MFELGLGDGSCGFLPDSLIGRVSHSRESPVRVSSRHLSPPLSPPLSATTADDPGCGCGSCAAPPATTAKAISNVVIAAQALGAKTEHFQAAAAEVVGTTQAQKMTPHAALAVAGIERVASRIGAQPGALLMAAKVPASTARAAGLVHRS